jgi:hypothetical protein
MTFLTFAPKTDTELQDLERVEQESRLLEEGAGTFEVLTSSFKKSDSGNPMIILDLKVWDKSGKEAFVRDFLLTSSARMEFKIKHFCYGTGLKAAYDEGKLSVQDCAGKTGKCEIMTQKPQRKKGTDEFYPAKSVIRDYFVSENSQSDGFDDDINL